MAFLYNRVDEDEAILIDVTMQSLIEKKEKMLQIVYQILYHLES